MYYYLYFRLKLFLNYDIFAAVSIINLIIYLIINFTINATIHIDPFLLSLLKMYMPSSIVIFIFNETLHLKNYSIQLVL